MHMMRNIFLKIKIGLIKADLRKLVLKEGVEPMVWWFGAYDIDPKHLVFVVGVPTDVEKLRLRANDALIRHMRELLIRRRWPQAARGDVVFDIESKESVDRESNGNWWHHYK
ncbi:hypothetical protein GN316_05020 [Xylophilus sp. Kf1]|nr:hypothetical protein [Xylophilus sp. Kf1]